MIVLKGRVLDGNGGAPIEKGAVVLEDNRIRLVCQQSELPDDPAAEVYELENGTIMPGLIDAHVHMGWGSATAVDWISMTPQLSMARALRDMAQLRQQGYTAFRDLGSDVLLMRPAVAEGLLDVPRIFGAGRIISQIGGHGDVYQKLSLEASQRAYSPAFIVNGVDEVRRAACSLREIRPLPTAISVRRRSGRRWRRRRIWAAMSPPTHRPHGASRWP